MRGIFLALTIMLLVVGCAATSLKGNPDLLAFLIDGRTTRAEVLNTLGEPSGHFEKDRILTYRLGFEPENKGYYVVEREIWRYSDWPTWLQAKYSLVLEFDNAGVLQRQSLVRVN